MYFVLLFDELLNKVFRHGQVDVHVKFLDDSVGKVVTQYLGSQLLECAAARGLVNNFLEVSRNLNL